MTKVSTHDNVADMLTKALDREPFVKLRRLLMQLVRVGVSSSMKLQPRRGTRAARAPEMSSVSTMCSVLYARACMGACISHGPGVFASKR